jgi:sporulation protein YlmC with PRC-barrel domain
MIRPATTLNGYQLLARDGTVGEVRDFFFDDELWQIRYLVVDTGRWLSSRRVLIAPEVVQQPEWDAQRLPSLLTKEQVRQSPTLDDEYRITRQQESELRQHYGWGDYRRDERGTAEQTGDADGLLDAPSDPAVRDRHPDAVTPAATPGAGADAELAAAARGAQQDRSEPHLQSVRVMNGYHVEARDGSIGHVEDVLLDVRTWEVRYLVVATRNWWPGQKVLVSPQLIDQVSWAESHVVVRMTRDEVKAGPQYDPERLEELTDERPLGRSTR